MSIRVIKIDGVEIELNGDFEVVEITGKKVRIVPAVPVKKEEPWIPWYPSYPYVPVYPNYPNNPGITWITSTSGTHTFGDSEYMFFNKNTNSLEY